MSYLDTATQEFRDALGFLEAKTPNVALAIIAHARVALDEMEARIKAKMTPDPDAFTVIPPPDGWLDKTLLEARANRFIFRPEDTPICTKTLPGNPTAQVVPE